MDAPNLESKTHSSSIVEGTVDRLIDTSLLFFNKVSLKYIDSYPKILGRFGIPVCVFRACNQEKVRLQKKQTQTTNNITKEFR